MTVLAFVRPTKVQSILKADQAPDSPLSEASLNSFGDAILRVTSFSVAARAATLCPPLPGKTPDWYPQLNKNLTTLQDHALNWINNIGPSMTAIPQAIIDYNNTFQGQYDTIVALLTAIGTNPPTEQQKKDLLTEMNKLLGDLLAKRKTVLDTQQSLIKFNSDISVDYTALNSGAASITNAIQTDKGDVVAMKGKIEALQLAMDKLHQELVWAGLGIAAGAIVGLIGLFVGLFTFGLGLFIGLAGVAGMIASTGVMIAAGVEIQQDADAIAEAMNEMNVDNQQIAVLNSVATTIGSLVQKGDVAVKAMATVLNDWATVTVKLQSVIDDLSAAEGDIGSILDLGDMKTTNAAWSQLAAYAQNMQNGIGGVVINDTPVEIKTGTGG